MANQLAKWPDDKVAKGCNHCHESWIVQCSVITELTFVYMPMMPYITMLLQLK